MWDYAEKRTETRFSGGARADGGHGDGDDAEVAALNARSDARSAEAWHHLGRRIGGSHLYFVTPPTPPTPQTHATPAGDAARYQTSSL